MTPTSEHDVSNKQPYLGLRAMGGGWEVVGQTKCHLGHRIPSGQPGDEGVFLHWEWNGRRLTVTNDRFGLYPLFYCARAGSIWVSPALEHVVRGNSLRRLDLPALAVFYRLGHFVGDDTPFEDIRFLPPNTTLVWEDGRLEFHGAGLDVLPSRGGRLSFDEAVDGYGELFARAIERRLPAANRFTVPISGGRDSRHILLELARQGYRPEECPTVKYRPPATNEDSRIARLLTERLGIRHVEVDKPRSFFDAALQDVHLTNHCGGGHGWILPIADYLAARVDVSYDGLAGDVLSAGHTLSPQRMDLYRRGDLEALARLLLSESGAERAVRRVLADGLYHQIPSALAVERLVRELRRHQGAANPAVAFTFWNRTRRCIASIPFAILQRVPTVHVPYLDHALFDFLFSLDASLIDGNRLHDEAIRRAYPDFADVPYENKSVRAVYSSDEQDYYPQARREFFGYLRRSSDEAVRVVRRPFLYAKVGLDLLTRQIGPPWYMRIAIQAVELERLRLGA